MTSTKPGFPLSETNGKPEQIGECDTSHFLHFQPTVAGQFKWSTMDELVFSPDVSFAFATSYAANPGKSLIQLLPELSGKEPIRFETQPR